ncbi:MAG: single-stranded-DNA-specific exonuclease RecJ [Candidatus Marinimicrobia bacterium]|nr:single-stranded-DNA-specific exonuclease RecJ [Candidatus Neomarinimicrobiota bacterium]MCH7954549.1 single-stranded-DNA-specific exonuclease RecJ [Candidatus Neomarinimicrobiota bacterium]
MDKVWSFSSDDEGKIAALSKDLELSGIIASLLINRGINNLEEAKLFFNPVEDHFHDPFLLEDMDKAVEIILSHIKRNSHLLIYGDYDVDGTTATSILYLALLELGARVTYYIPRRDEGYGLSSKGIESARQVGIELIITCDCGITSHEEIALAKSFGMEVIVTDHHEVMNTLPTADAVVNPKRPSSSYPFNYLSGAGVALKVVQALRKQVAPENWYAREYYDLAALGTAADIVPMIGENRVIVSLGLPEIYNRNRVGLRALLESSNFSKDKITLMDVVFNLAPRINAVGRMGEAREAVELFTTNDPERGKQLAKKFDQMNKKRRSVDLKTFMEAEQQMLERYDPDQPCGVVLYADDWHQGVIGIVASRLTEKFYRPTVMISLNGEIGKGSGRSIPEFNLHSVLKECSDLLIGFGGHEQAGGMTIKRSNLQDFVDKFDDVVSSRLTPDLMTKKIKVEAILNFNEIDKKLLKIIDRLEPYGPENDRPVFVSKGTFPTGNATIVGENHLKVKFEQKNRTIDAIGFNMAEYLTNVLNPPDEGIDIAYALEENVWKGNKYIQIILKDLK